MSGKAARKPGPPPAERPADAGARATRRICLTGHVQGVGFRPFVFRLAREHGITGWVRNRLGEVEIRAQGDAAAVARFRDGLVTAAPPLSRPTLSADEPAEGDVYEDFRILDSAASESPRIFVPPDYFMCEDCRAELTDPTDRRHRYPFINCTQCGPRYTLIEALPYDRPNTSMAAFPLCPECQREYLDPSDRRFHAEPVACPACGPSVSLRAGGGTVGAREAALAGAVGRLRAGDILAVKGIGGYHLMCSATDAAAVARLRARKPRPDKPLAVMFPLSGDDGLDALRRAVRLRAGEADCLLSPMRPIVLAALRDDCPLAHNLAPGLGELGVFLPYSPLHQLLTADFGAPLVATSGNISGEPVLTDADDAERRLAHIADAFLHHDRPIVRPADDPVFRTIGGRVRPIRIGRGCAPKELTLPWRLAEPVLAVGGHMKNTLALAWEDRVVVSPHIGDMGTPRSMQVFEQIAGDLQSLYGMQARRIIADAHPGYDTHRWARRSALPMETVWHHHAHASAVAAESAREGRWLVFAWDGVGLGEDGSLWGGEALVGRPGAWRRIASMRRIALPGGDRAGREPWRSAAAMHWECGLAYEDGPDDIELARRA
ncbi:MAG: carbamoyltransferase HypF, partial [Gammaproteobacteria bacterium]